MDTFDRSRVRDLRNPARQQGEQVRSFHQTLTTPARFRTPRVSKRSTSGVSRRSRFRSRAARVSKRFRPYRIFTARAASSASVASDIAD
jgi:hypothetical protein